MVYNRLISMRLEELWNILWVAFTTLYLNWTWKVMEKQKHAITHCYTCCVFTQHTCACVRVCVVERGGHCTLHNTSPRQWHLMCWLSFGKPRKSDARVPEKDDLMIDQLVMLPPSSPLSSLSLSLSFVWVPHLYLYLIRQIKSTSPLLIYCPAVAVKK